MKKIYWVVAWKPREDYVHVLFSSKKPYYLKSENAWTTQTDDKDWEMSECWILGDKNVTEEYFKPRKVEISTQFIND